MAKPKDDIEAKLGEILFDLNELDKDINAYELFVADADIIKDIKKVISILENVERKIVDITEKALHPGAVCSCCGNKMTEDEYADGRSECCKKAVISEEEY